MAFREVRIHFKDITDEVAARKMNVEIGQPFEWVMDGIMRGSFKLYSGPEVKGVNLVNLICHSRASAKKILERHEEWKVDEWSVGLNAYNCSIVREFASFEGNRQEKVKQAVCLFLEVAKKSNLPQMATLIEQANLKLDARAINQAIEKVDSNA